MMAITKFLAGGAAIAALASAAPAAAQYYPGYGYGNPYGGAVGGYGYGINSQAVVNQCANAVQARLNGSGYGYGGYGYGGGYGAGRVLGISQVSPRNDGGITVRGVAASGRYAGYGYAPQSPDLTWRCRTDFRGFIREVTINRAEPGYGYGYTPYNGYDYSQYGYRRY